VDSLRGKLLVAGPALVDPNFHRSVVLICEHSEEGALGLVLNRPTPLEVAEAVPDLGEQLDGDAQLWIGGPVQPESIVLLAEFEDTDGALLVEGDIGLVTDGTALDGLAERTRRIRPFLGYAGWGPGQLEGELERDDWIVSPLGVADAFTDTPHALWSGVLERMGGRYALVARMPIDPSLN